MLQAEAMMNSNSMSDEENNWSEPTSDDERMPDMYPYELPTSTPSKDDDDWRKQPPPAPPHPERMGETHASRPTRKKQRLENLPETDKDALDTLQRLAGDRWCVSNCGTVYTYCDRRKLWSANKHRFSALCMQYKSELGTYGSMVNKIRSLMELAKSVNEVGDEWVRNLDRLDSGQVPLLDGIYDVATDTLRPIEKFDNLTKTFDCASLASHEQYDDERAKVELIFDNIFPEPQLKREVMTRLAESFFSSRNDHKYFVQMYGEGNNGKTTIMRIMQSAFPMWVAMPNVDNLIARRNRNPDGPQPWLVQVKDKRILGFEEPPRGSKFDGSLLKLLRGNGVLNGRGLYQDITSYVPSFTLWIATNSPIEIEPVDQAVLNSFHSFELPSCFVEAGEVAPLGTKFKKDKISNVERLFVERPYQMALFKMLSEYYRQYLRDGGRLPPLTSQFSTGLTNIYHDEHPGLDKIFDSCVQEDKDSKVSLQNLISVLQKCGYRDGDKKLRLFMEDRFKNHKFVQKTKPHGTTVWKGLRTVQDPFDMGPAWQFDQFK